MNKQSLLVIALIVIVFGGLLFFRQNNPAQEQFATNGVPPAPAALDKKEVVLEEDEGMMEEDEGMMEEDKMMDEGVMEGGMRVFNVDGGNYSFSLKDIKVKQGETVKIVFNNVGGTHNWVIDEFNASTDTIGTGQTSEVTFIADQAGTFEYYCSVGKHRELGMVGTLVVEVQ